MPERTKGAGLFLAHIADGQVPCNYVILGFFG